MQKSKKFIITCLLGLCLITFFIISNIGVTRVYHNLKLGDYEIYNCRFVKGRLINQVSQLAYMALATHLWPTENFSFELGLSDDTLIFNGHHYKNAWPMPDKFSEHDPAKVYLKSDEFRAFWGQNKGGPEENITIPIYKEVDNIHFRVVKRYYIRPSNDTVFAKLAEADYSNSDFNDPYYEYRLRIYDMNGKCEIHIR